MKTITIIGAGLSGTLLSINLLQQGSPERIKINWIDRNSENEMGFAYSTTKDYLLNVPVELMGAFSSDPEHFMNWVRKRDIRVKSGDYLPRKLYRQYIQEILDNAMKRKKDNIQLERIRDNATDIKVNKRLTKVSLEKHGSIKTDKVVLAIGNPLPSNPVVKHREYKLFKKYTQNPWDSGVLSGISKNDSLIFIGTGQTMVDLLTGLYKRKHKGELIGISRRGVLPMSQKILPPYPTFYDELKDFSDILSVFKVVHKHLKAAREKNMDPRSVIDSLRPHTTAIWMNLPPEEKRRFLRHLFRYWEIIRSRIPPESETILNNLKKSGQLKIFAGNITDIIPQDETLQVNFTSRKSKSQQILSANYVINCKGPDLNYEKNDQPLIKNLFARKLICCDPAHIGINALPDGPVLSEEGKPSDIIYTIGPPLKGIVWESIATPEIREEAEKLAELLVEC